MNWDVLGDVGDESRCKCGYVVEIADVDVVTGTDKGHGHRHRCSRLRSVRTLLHTLMRRAMRWPSPAQKAMRFQSRKVNTIVGTYQACVQNGGR